jgi:hypothetical protein
MTFWEMFNNHPFFGFFVAFPAIVASASVAETLINAAAGVLKTRWGGCDCVPCDLEHVEDDEEAEPSESVEKP